MGYFTSLRLGFLTGNTRMTVPTLLGNCANDVRSAQLPVGVAAFPVPSEVPKAGGSPAGTRPKPTSFLPKLSKERRAEPSFTGGADTGGEGLLRPGPRGAWGLGREEQAGVLGGPCPLCVWSSPCLWGC